MLKPNLAVDDSSADHMPHLVTVYNRAQPSDLVPEMLRQTYAFYRLSFQKSRLHISNEAFTKNGPTCWASTEPGTVNFVPLLDWNASDDQWLAYNEAIPALKRALLALPRLSFGPAGLNEKSWFVYPCRHRPRRIRLIDLCTLCCRQVYVRQ